MIVDQQQFVSSVVDVRDGASVCFGRSLQEPKHQVGGSVVVLTNDT
jgi:hypothetical protein